MPMEWRYVKPFIAWWRTVMASTWFLSNDQSSTYCRMNARHTENYKEIPMLITRQMLGASCGASLSGS